MGETLTTLEQLEQLKALTVRYNTLHEAQALQLKMWPCLLANINDVTVKVGVEEKRVVFLCSSESGRFRNTKKVQTFCSNLEKWVRTILWNETQISFMVDDRLIFGAGYAAKE